jgi:hypothetical protein
VLKVPQALIEHSVSQDYFLQLLKRALAAGANGRAVPDLVETTLVGQERAIHELVRGELLDIYWLGTSADREGRLRAIPIPLDHGLLGFRRFIIRRDMAEQFDSVMNLQDLQKFTACQGLSWPDTRILREAGLRVVELAGYETLYRAVTARRCDYYPRGYHEAFREIARHQANYPELTTYESLILYYPFTAYYFVSQQNEELAEWVERGLEQMIASGEFMAFMQQHPFTSPVFPLGSGPEDRWIFLRNPILPENTDYKNPRYWFRPKDFMFDK